MPDKQILVTGTTGDYIDMIARRFPGRTMFLTDAAERAFAREPPPPPPYELICDLSRPDEAIAMLDVHLRKRSITLGGIACFDCESMSLASRIAGKLSLPYPSAEAIAACRSKFTCKQLWRKARLPCPETACVRNASEACAFLKRIARPAVLKPIAASGSQFVFLCSTPDDCIASFRIMDSSLPDLRRDPAKPIYSRERVEANGDYVIEEFIQGFEYSCDFALDGERLEIIRIARKIPARDRTFGVTSAYVLPSGLPASIDPVRFHTQLIEAARALGLERAICMLDFIVNDDKALMLEMTPRPGGDCLPPLILKSSGLDILGLALDFADGRFPAIPAPSEWKQLVGLRLFAGSPGIIASVNSEKLVADKRVFEYYQKITPGDEVVFPPADYDSQILGHVIFKPEHFDDIENECASIAGLLKVSMEKI